ncbi:soil-associated protein, TIGR03435 family [Terriglobus roseus]|uniref:Soil-associated protein, TIGR03435 family n=1 Tax=Terriglobus roseus TaxID=392734 RepID=A0A1G7MKJ2_9BACT|nr:soil-associated protein, TIGR03435 family [Terriglobus roseus]
MLASVQRTALALLLLGACRLPAQSTTPDWQTAAGTHLSFEVATIKPNTSDEPAHGNFTLGPGDAYTNTGGRFLTKNISLLDYIRFAWKLTDGQVALLEASAPKWVSTAGFDIEAKSDLPNPTKDQMRLMVQSLLADRFALHTHTETHELPALAMVLITPGKPGPELHPHSPTDNTCSGAAPSPNQPSIASTPNFCGSLRSNGVASSPSHVRITGQKVPLTLLAAQLGQMGGFGRPILDQTGLTGTVDLTLEWGPDSDTEPMDSNSRQTYMQRALRDQLGIKLDPRTAPVTVLLIDHINPQPSAN